MQVAADQNGEDRQYRVPGKPVAPGAEAADQLALVVLALIVFGAEDMLCKARQA